MTRAKIVLAVVVLMGIGFSVSYWLYFRNVCLPVKSQKIYAASGLAFRIEDIDCDALAKEEIERVYISRRGHTEEDLLFAFDPEFDANPAVNVSGKTIEISVSRVSSIYFRRLKWKNMDVRYRIGHIQYAATQSGS